ncbi:peptide transporter [Achromobacter sp. NPDC058515]|uniref:peptide transporter n=1 Tax=Achromobacter sp. NPDC058515 TaxID=3346533 RepID=UPI00366039CA
MRESQPFMVVGIDRPIIDRELKNVVSKDYAAIGGAPQAADPAVSAIKAASLILIPVQSSPYEICATSDLVDPVKRRIDLTDGKLQTAFVVSKAIQSHTDRDRGYRRSHWLRPAGACSPHYAASKLRRQRRSRQTILDTEPDGDGAAEVRAPLAEIKKKLIGGIE